MNEGYRPGNTYRHARPEGFDTWYAFASSQKKSPIWRNIIIVIQICPVGFREFGHRFTSLVDEFVVVLHEEEGDDDLDFKLGETHTEARMTA